jgi:hypothetical protein
MKVFSYFHKKILKKDDSFLIILKIIHFYIKNKIFLKIKMILFSIFKMMFTFIFKYYIFLLKSYKTLKCLYFFI